MAAPRFLQRVGGILTDLAAAVLGGAAAANQIVGTNASGLIDASFFPAGLGADIITVPASEALAAGAIVNLYTNGSACNARNADNSAANAAKKASGFVLAAVASGASASVYRSGMITGLSGLTAGADYYLGTGGGLVTAPPSASGTTAHLIGTAISATVLDMQTYLPIAIT